MPGFVLRPQHLVATKLDEARAKRSPGPAPQRFVASQWCAAWSAGCPSPKPPYRWGMSFWDVFDDNMVLQMEPAAAAVYGVATATCTAS